MRCSSHALPQPYKDRAFPTFTAITWDLARLAPAILTPVTSNLVILDLVILNLVILDLVILALAILDPVILTNQPSALTPLRLVVRDLSEQLAQTYLPPEAHATAWQRLRAGGR